MAPPGLGKPLHQSVVVAVQENHGWPRSAFSRQPIKGVGQCGDAEIPRPHISTQS